MFQPQPRSSYNVSEYSVSPLSANEQINGNIPILTRINSSNKDNDNNNNNSKHQHQHNNNVIHHHKHSASRSIYVSTLLLLVWLFSSVSSTLTNKSLMDAFPYSATLTLIQLLASVIVDMCIIYYRGLSLYPFNKQLFIETLPVAAAINFSKTLTYVSYAYVPASLTHTAKASSPIFSVILTKLIHGQLPSKYVLFSLIPITTGVTLSALTEINFVLFGFICAVIASVAAVLNTLYGKQALHHVSCPDPIIFHFYASVSAVLMVAPYAIFSDSIDIYNNFNVAHDSNDTITYPVLLRMIIFSLSMHYAQNISSVYYLHGTTVLTHQVVGTAKRLVVIISTVLYFGNPVGLLNAIGMCIAVLGYFCYGYAKHYSGNIKASRKNSRESYNSNNVSVNNSNRNSYNNSNNIIHNNNNINNNTDIEMSAVNKPLQNVQNLQNGLHVRRNSNILHSPNADLINEARITIRDDSSVELQKLLRASDSNGDFTNIGSYFLGSLTQNKKRYSDDDYNYNIEHNNDRKYTSSPASTTSTSSSESDIYV